MSKVTIQNVHGTFRSLGTRRGNPRDILRDLTLETINLKLSDEKFTLGPTENFVVKNVVVNGQAWTPPIVR